MLAAPLVSTLSATLPAADAPAPPTGTVVAAAPAPRPPRRPRGELLLSLGVAGGGTSWAGDPTGYGSLKLGLRLFRVLTPFVQARLGYGRVDQRLLTFLSVGLEAGAYLRERAFPHAYVAFVHQHEESMAAVAAEPAGALLGIGAGIRHRAGLQFGLGCDVVVLRRPGYEFTVGPEAMVAYLTYSAGPQWYGLAGIAAGGHFRLF